MPRAPKTATQSKRPQGEEKQKDAMKEAKGQRKANGALPLIGELAGACGAWAANPSGALPLEQIRELSHKAWEAKMGSWSSSTAPVKDLDMGPLEDALPAVFKALERTCLASESGSLRAQNGLAGLALAALVLDLSAMRAAPEVQPGEEAVAKAVSFLWHQARFFLPGRLEAKAFSDASTLALALARGLRSVHHVMARRSYAGHALPAASLVHKSAPLAGQCAALAAGGASTQAAKALATLGDAAGDLLVALSGCGCTEASMQSSAVSEMSRLCTQGPMYRGCSSGSLLALLLRSVAAQLLPLKIHSKAPKELQILCRDHLARSEARASALCAALVQHGLLEAERKDQVQLLVQQLVALCQDPRWAAAPLLCRRLALALFRVAGASRAVELDCAQREEATKLLASVAGALCAQRAGSSEPVDVAPLKRRKQPSPAMQLPLACKEGWREAWALQAWAEFGHLPAPGDASDASEPPIRATRCAASLYRKLQWGDASSLLSRTRTGALESLLSLAKSSPLAHVRRQALLGLGAACAAEAELICSRCMAEAVAAGLQDEAAFARLAALELVAQLKPQGADGSARVKELRQLARQRLADCSVLVRRGAFRAALGWLEELEMPGQLAEAGELLRRLRTETPQIRAQALPVLQRLLFDDAEVSVARLRVVHVQSGAGCLGVRDLLAARCKALEEKGGEAQATAAMEHLAKCTMKLLAGSSPETVEDSSREGSAPSFALLEQLSLERPEALHRQLGQFLPWLAASDVSGSLERPMAACGILAQVLPSWGAAASSLAKQKMARDLARSLARLLDEHTAPATDLGQLARQAVRCLAAVAEHLGAAGPQARELLMGHFGRSIRVLAEDVEAAFWVVGSWRRRGMWRPGVRVDRPRRPLDSDSREVYSESWRFQGVCEAYAEFLEGRALRDQFLTSLLGDLGSGLKLQLAVGILARLPLSKEPELARVFHCAVRFLTLKVAPLLDEAAEDAPGAEDARLCACGAVLHRLCVQWLGLVGGELVKQMRETWAQPTLATDFDQALPMSFKRRSVVDLSELWRLEGVESHGLLLREMENSPLLGKAVRPAALAAPKAVPKKRSAEEPKGPKAKARKQATEAAASAKAAAVAMSKAAAGA
ncbi:unnamed protein product [Effrenium voratum]|nr:unnamed protein product [Effrenium voratum]